MLQCLLHKVKIAQKKHLIIANILTPGKQGIKQALAARKVWLFKIKEYVSN